MDVGAINWTWNQSEQLCDFLHQSSEMVDVKAEKAGRKIYLRLRCARQCDERQKAPAQRGRTEGHEDKEPDIFK